MLLDQGPLTRRQPSRFGQQLLRHGKNTDVMHQPDERESSQFRAIIAETNANLRPQDTDVNKIGDQRRPWWTRQRLND